MCWRLNTRFLCKVLEKYSLFWEQEGSVQRKPLAGISSPGFWGRLVGSSPPGEEVIRAPVDAVGCQAHSSYNLPATTVQANIDRIAAETGLPVYITEYDIDIEDDVRQMAVMQEQFSMFWENQNIKGITLWGYVYGQTWMAHTGLIYDDGSMRPAMSWLLSFLGR